ncbi:MAG: PQQ-dependent sugar dehydrogenase [Burkholderiaceae bacterium]
MSSLRLNGRLTRAFLHCLLICTVLGACGGGGPTAIGADSDVAQGDSAATGADQAADGGSSPARAGDVVDGDLRADAIDGAGGSNGDLPATDPTRVGLNVRPKAPSCIAPGEPNGGLVRAQAMYSRLPFDGALLNLEQARMERSHWYTHTRDGRIYRFATAGDGSDAHLLLDLGPRLAGLEYEGGLIGLTLDPAFSVNGYVYLHYTIAADPIRAVISRMTVREGRIDPASELVIQRIDHGGAIHLGGQLAFGPDGLLHASVGDNEYGDPSRRAQDPRVLQGKLLRYDVRGASPERPFEIPLGNRHHANPRCALGAGSDACPEWFATGFRNPWRFSFDRTSAVPDIWLTDVGHTSWEEINRIGPGGGNFGWSVREGAHCFATSGCATSSAEAEPFTDPVFEYPNAGFAAAVGGYIYRGSALPGLSGEFVFADFAQSQIFALRRRGNRYEREILIDQAPGNPVAFAQADDGELYFLVYARTGSRIFKLAAASQLGDTVPDQLSASGCVDPAAPTRAAAGMMPFEPRAPFWSDGAIKRRWLSMPDAGRITINEKGQFEFPLGSVLMKTFELNGRLIETRLLMRHTDTGNWAGYSYRWNPDQTEATRVRESTWADINGQGWIYPSGSECQKCHTEAGGRTLGTNLSQLNHDYRYDETGRTANQLATLAGLGMMSGLPGDLPTRVSPYDVSAPLSERARSWLDTNCAQCHRPGGPLSTRIDLRLGASIEQTGICNASAGHELGIDGARIVDPGQPERSVLYLRAARRDSFQMPPLGSRRVDSDGLELLASWIRSMDGDCH